MKHVIELIRVSTEAQAGIDRASIPAQRTVNRRTASNFGLEIVESIEISDVSGAAVLAAPEIQKLLRWIQSPDIQGIVTREFSRLMRPDKFTDYVLLQVFADTNTVIYLPEGPIDLSSKTGRLMGTIRAAIAGLEKTEIQERVFSAKEEKRKRGENPSPAKCLPRGVGYEKGRGWFYDGDHSEKIRQAFQMLLAGELSFFRICAETGIGYNSLKQMLLNPIWTGVRAYRFKRDLSIRRIKKDGRQGDRPKILRTPEEEIRVRVIDEPIISEEDFNRAQMLLDVKRRNSIRERKVSVENFVYNGFLECAKCGGMVYTFTQHRTTSRYYACRNKMKPPPGVAKCDSVYMAVGHMEQKLDAVLADQCTRPEFLQMLEEFNRQQPEQIDQVQALERLEKQISILTSKRLRVVDAFIEGLLSHEARNERLANIDVDLRRAQESLVREGRKPQIPAIETLSNLFQPFFEWRMLERQDKRRLLSAMVPRISVANYAVRSLRVLPCDSLSSEGSVISLPDEGSFSCHDSRLHTGTEATIMIGQTPLYGFPVRAAQVVVAERLSA